jgi:dipeptidase
MIVRSEDSPAGRFIEKKFRVVKPTNAKKYVSVISKCEVDLPENPLQYTACPNATPEEGNWESSAVNSLNIGMSATETIATSIPFLGVDPLVDSGLGEEDYVTLTIPYIKSAREGVLRIAELIEKYGTYEMNGIAFNDENEVWWIETIGGHHWIAKRVPDDCYVVNPNQQGIDVFDFADAYGEKKNHMCSADLVDFIVKNRLDMNFTEGDLKTVKDYKIRVTVGTQTDFDKTYNTCRAWFVLRYFNPHENFEPEAFDLPWAKKPEHKVSLYDIKYVMSSYFNCTKFNPYLKHGDKSEIGKYRYIGINRTGHTALIQIRGYMPDKIKAIKWISFGSNAFNSFIPQYTQISDTPKYLTDIDHTVTTNNMYWTNRIIAALTDAHYNSCSVPVEQYQLKVLAKSLEFINEFDKKFIQGGVSDKFLEECNQKISDYFEVETNKLLNDVLYKSSCEMKNSFARSDA